MKTYNPYQKIFQDIWQDEKVTWADMPSHNKWIDGLYWQHLEKKASEYQRLWDAVDELVFQLYENYKVIDQEKIDAAIVRLCQEVKMDRQDQILRGAVIRHFKDHECKERGDMFKWFAEYTKRFAENKGK